MEIGSGIFWLIALLAGMYIVFDLAKLSRRLLSGQLFEVVTTLAGAAAALYLASFWPFAVCAIAIAGKSALIAWRRRAVRRRASMNAGGRDDNYDLCKFCDSPRLIGCGCYDDGDKYY